MDHQRPSAFPLIVAITGPSASGKTMLAETVYSELLEMHNADGKVVMLQEDYYYRDQSHMEFVERERTNYDHPSAFEHDLLERHLVELSEHRSVEVPQYDFTQHTRAQYTKQVEPARAIILEGILLLTDPALRKRYTTSVFVDTDIETCLQRRLIRDTTERGRTRESVIEQFEATVRPMYHEYVHPSREYADIIATEGGKDRATINILVSQIVKAISAST